ncbi:MAG TPA: RES family NAD+ phosphorylase [Bacteroidales bacterium]
MIVYRLSKSKYSNDLSGRGAERSGGRWNSKGVAMIYTGESRALCTTEIAVHTPLGNIPTDYEIISIEIPDALIGELDITTLREDWKSFPHPHFTQETEDKFISDNIYLALKVPSAVVPGDFNYLINPHYKDFSQVKITDIGSFEFDERLFNK